MSIEIEDPKTLMEKIDAVANFIEQMFLAKMARQDGMFVESHKKASRLMHEIIHIDNGGIEKYIDELEHYKWMYQQLEK